MTLLNILQFCSLVICVKQWQTSTAIGKHHQKCPVILKQSNPAPPYSNCITYDGWNPVNICKLSWPTVDGRNSAPVVVDIPVSIGFYMHPRWLFGISSINSTKPQLSADPPLLTSLESFGANLPSFDRPRWGFHLTYSLLKGWLNDVTFCSNIMMKTHILKNTILY